MPSDNWARRLTDLSQVPRVFREALPHRAESIPHIIYAPTDRWGWRKAHPKILCVAQDAVTLLELGRNGVGSLTIPLSAVAGVEMGRILLYSWLTITGTGRNGTVAVKVEFNSVVESVFQPLAAMIRTATAGIHAGDREALRHEWRKLDPLAKESYKYANFAKASLLPGERVRVTAFEPGIQRKTWRGTRTVVPANLAVLTDRELILIRDAPRREALENYGGVWHYLALERVAGLAVEQERDGMCSLIAQASGDYCVRCVFSTAHEGRVRRLRASFERQRRAEVEGRR